MFSFGVHISGVEEKICNLCRLYVTEGVRFDGNPGVSRSKRCPGQVRKFRIGSLVCGEGVGCRARLVHRHSIKIKVRRVSCFPSKIEIQLIAQL